MVNTPTIRMVLTLKFLEVTKFMSLRNIALLCIFAFWNWTVMKHIRPENKNTIAILCMNGKSGANKKIKNDKTNDVSAAISTLKVVALFQKRAIRKITRIPGVKNPVKFWIYWNADSMLPNRGFAQMTAIKRLIQATFLPIFTKDASDTSLLERFL